AAAAAGNGGENVPTSSIPGQENLTAAYRSSSTPNLVGNFPPQSGQVQDRFSSQDTFATLPRQSSYIPPNSQPMPQMYNMSHSTPGSSQQLNGNGVTVPPTGFSQAEFQPIRANGFPAYPSEVPNPQVIQHQRMNSLPGQPVPPPVPAAAQQQQQQFYANGTTQPNSIPQQFVLPAGKMSSSQSSSDSNWSLNQNQNQKESDTSLNTSTDDPKKLQSQNLSPPMENTYAAQLLRFFSDDNAEIPYFIVYPPANFNINEPIDDEGHTPLHWAASIGNYDMIHLLMSKGANPLVVNSFGLNPLSKLISFNNCFELQNFPKVLDDLELCLINTDINGRTPLHYLCEFAKAKNKAESLNYYLKVILSKLTILSNQSQVRQIDLMKNVLNHQDVHGDTCLHIAVRSNSASIAKLILQYGAHDDLENINRETARQLIVQYNIIPNYTQVEVSQSTFQQQLQLGMGSYQNFNGISGTNNNNNLASAPGLATPIQPSHHRAETPDTQRTTVQDDELDDDDDDDDSTVARVDKRHIDALTDNKENIFLDKQFDSVSTPIHKKHHPMNGHQPLAVISEVDSTVLPTTQSEKLPSNQEQPRQQSITSVPPPPPAPLPQQQPQVKFETESYNPKPPIVSDDGKIIETDSNELEPKLPMRDLSSMVSGMINSLSDTYSDEINKLDSEADNLQELITTKQRENQDSIMKLQKVLSGAGIHEPKIDSIEQGQSLVVETIEICERSIQEKEQALLRVIQRNQAYKLAKLVEEEEMKHLQEHNEDEEENNALIDENQVDYAIELTQLQLERNKLVHEIVRRTKFFGIDEKMYKYRRLLSLSCGVKVEEIDSLIDGIAESLTESMN
ncbi:hypothetical protein G210_2920, partial [Candida maltosa Xu316]